MNAPINLSEKFACFDDLWHPHIVGALNENYVKLAKVKGEFVWHKHDAEDELFIVLEGTLYIEFRDKTVTIAPGQILIVPKGVEHRPFTLGETVKLMLIEPKSTLHTGTEKTTQTVAVQDQKHI